MMYMRKNQAENKKYPTLCDIDELIVCHILNLHDGNILFAKAKQNNVFWLAALSKITGCGIATDENVDDGIIRIISNNNEINIPIPLFQRRDMVLPWDGGDHIPKNIIQKIAGLDGRETHQFGFSSEKSFYEYCSIINHQLDPNDNLIMDSNIYGNTITNNVETKNKEHKNILSRKIDFIKKNNITDFIEDDIEYITELLTIDYNYSLYYLMEEEIIHLVGNIIPKGK